MGVKLGNIIQGKELELKDLSGKVIVVDSFNVLYQFLASIRQRDGTLLMDSQGRVTSHLTGLFSRTTRLLEAGVKPAFAFDGRTPKLKRAEQERRHLIKEEAEEQYKEAKEAGDVEAMRKFSSRTSALTPEMVAEAKKLISSLGLPVIEAPAEGEAQAAHIVRKGEAYAVASEDFDSLLFGAQRLVRRLNITGRRRVAGTLSTKAVVPEMISLPDALSSLGIDREQLICLGLLTGTDYNPGGVKGIGPKKALKLLHEHRKDFDGMFSAVEWEKHCSSSWKEVFALFTDAAVSDEYDLTFRPLDRDAVRELLVEGHDFSAERIDATLDKLDSKKDRKQKGLSDFF